MLNIYEKYKISKFDDFDDDIQIHYKNVINIFKSLSQENLPNILLYGEHGSGKLSLLYSFLYRLLSFYTLKIYNIHTIK